jgi:chromate reductase
MVATLLEHEPPYQVGYFVGSLSRESINRDLSKALVKVAPPELVLEEIPIGNLPLYNRDLDVDYPPVAREFKAAIALTDAVLFITPEYNRSMPGALKNAIDWASRPWGDNSFTGKASAVIGASPGKIGTAVAQQALGSVLAFCNSPQMNQPEAFIQATPGLFSADGSIGDPSTEDFLRSWMDAFLMFIERVLTVVPQSSRTVT